MSKYRIKFKNKTANGMRETISDALFFKYTYVFVLNREFTVRLPVVVLRQTMRSDSNWNWASTKLFCSFNFFVGMFRFNSFLLMISPFELAYV